MVAHLRRLLLLTCGATSFCDAVSQSNRTENLLQAASQYTKYSTLVSLVEQTSLASFLSVNAVPVTFLAPDNDAFDEAFSSLTPAQEDDLRNNADLLTAVLALHVIPGVCLHDYDLTDQQELTPLQGANFIVGVSADSTTTLTALTTGEIANINDDEVVALNGIIHGIDKVFLPPLLFGPSKEPRDPSLPPPPSLLALLYGMTEYSHFVTALLQVGVADILSTSGPFTVIAPDNAAFDATLAALPPQQRAALQNDTDSLLTNILKYHIIQGEYFIVDLEDADELITLQNEPVTISISSDKTVVTFSSPSITATVSDTASERNIVAHNGLIYGIAMVLIPPSLFQLDAFSSGRPATPPDSGSATIRTIWQLASSLENYSALELVVDDLDLNTFFSEEGLFTILAPNNNAFDAFFGSISENESTVLARISSYHVIEGAILGADFVDGMELTTLQGATLTVRIACGTVKVVGANTIVTVTAPDLLMGFNGVIHGIDTVLLPPTSIELSVNSGSVTKAMYQPQPLFVPAAVGTVVDVISGLEKYTTFMGFIEGAGLFNALSEGGPFTILAADNNAFMSMFMFQTERGKMTLLDEIKLVLMNHIISGDILTTDFIDGMQVTTLAGDNLTVRVLCDTITFTGAGRTVTVNTAERLAMNGRIHGIDSVLIPKSTLGLLTSWSTPTATAAPTLTSPPSPIPLSTLISGISQNSGVSQTTLAVAAVTATLLMTIGMV